LKNQYFKHFFNYFIVIIFAYLSIYTVNAQDFLQTIVIDPGHGGKDPGNLGTEKYNLTEKDIVLEISLLLGEKIKNNFTDINVVYTREKDLFIPLHERTKIANSQDGDLFISIHCNWWKNEHACGIETYVMGLNKFEDNLDIVKKENSVIYLENNYSQNYEGFDPESTESLIALTLYQDNYFHNSLILSNKIQSKLIKTTGSKDRGVKQAPFWVISRVNMPSVLVEIGFLTCPQEEKYLNSKEGQENIANSIFEAFVDYKTGFSNSANKDSVYEDSSANNIKEEVKYKNFLFKIQLGVFSNKNIDLEKKLIDNLIDFEIVRENNLYKYFVFHSNDFASSKLNLSNMINLGFKDSFIKSNKNIKK